MSILTSVINSVLDGGYRVMKVLRFGKSDVQTADEATPYGLDSSAVKDMIAVFSDTVTKGEPVIIGYLNKQQLAQPGEFRLYSTDNDGNLITYIWLHNAAGDGQIELGGTTDNAVLYSKLETAFNQLKNDFNNFVTIFNSHVHPGVQTGGGSSAVTTTLGTDSSADITPAKNNKIKTL